MNRIPKYLYVHINHTSMSVANFEFCVLVLVDVHCLRASGDDQASSGVPPQLLENSPNGTLY